MLVKTAFYKRWKNTFSRRLKRRRLAGMLKAAGFPMDNSAPARPLRVLELGCSSGRDAIQFMTDANRYEIVGVDIHHNEIPQANVTFLQCDASELPFADKSFDVVLSGGLLGHIEPMEKLCAMAREIDRVGRAWCHVVPSISTPLEPHTASLWWPRRHHAKLVEKDSAEQILHLNFFSDHTWSKFDGFRAASIRRFWYFFPFIRNLLIYKTCEEDRP